MRPRSHSLEVVKVTAFPKDAKEYEHLQLTLTATLEYFNKLHLIQKGLSSGLVHALEMFPELHVLGRAADDMNVLSQRAHENHDRVQDLLDITKNVNEQLRALDEEDNRSDNFFRALEVGGGGGRRRARTSSTAEILDAVKISTREDIIETARQKFEEQELNYLVGLVKEFRKNQVHLTGKIDPDPFVEIDEKLERVVQNSRTHLSSSVLENFARDAHGFMIRFTSCYIEALDVETAKPKMFIGKDTRNERVKTLRRLCSKLDSFIQKRRLVQYYHSGDLRQLQKFEAKFRKVRGAVKRHVIVKPKFDYTSFMCLRDETFEESLKNLRALDLAILHANKKIEIARDPFDNDNDDGSVEANPLKPKKMLETIVKFISSGFGEMSDLIRDFLKASYRQCSKWQCYNMTLLLSHVAENDKRDSSDKRERWSAWLDKMSDHVSPEHLQWLRPKITNPFLTWIPLESSLTTEIVSIDKADDVEKELCKAQLDESEYGRLVLEGLREEVAYTRTFSTEKLSSSARFHATAKSSSRVKFLSPLSFVDVNLPDDVTLHVRESLLYSTFKAVERAKANSKKAKKAKKAKKRRAKKAKKAKKPKKAKKAKRVKKAKTA